jgi:hypothetical protein
VRTLVSPADYVRHVSTIIDENRYYAVVITDRGIEESVSPISVIFNGLKLRNHAFGTEVSELKDGVNYVEITMSKNQALDYLVAYVNDFMDDSI